MLRDDLHAEIARIPVIDVHSHLTRDRMAAKDLNMVVFYHMVSYPLRACGVAEDRIWPGANFHGAQASWDAMFAHWDQIGSTSFGWALRTILRDLYDFDQPLSADTLPALEQAFADRTAREDWGRQVLAKAGVRRVLSSRIDSAPPAGEHDPTVRFTIESAPMAGYREHQPPADRLAKFAERVDMELTSIKAVREAYRAFYDRFDWSDKGALVSWITAAADFRPVDESTLDGILARALAGESLSPDESALLEAALVRCTCQAVREHTDVFQICYGTQFLTPGRPHPVNRRGPQFTSSLGWLFGEFPDLHFNLLTGYEPDEPLLCSHCLAYSNVSLAGFWWNTFYRSSMHAAWDRRLDMVPTPALCGFFSDGWCVDWIYGRLRLTQKVLAGVLAGKVEQGWYSPDEAVRVARELLLVSPARRFLTEQDQAHALDD
jgi:glucuronate isomerase